MEELSQQIKAFQQVLEDNEALKQEMARANRDNDGKVFKLKRG